MSSGSYIKSDSDIFALANDVDYTDKIVNNIENIEEGIKKEKIDLLKEKDDKNKLQGLDEESSFNEGLHKLIMKSLGFTFDEVSEEVSGKKFFKLMALPENTDKCFLNFPSTKDPLSEKNLNKILPAIRTQYIREWKKVVNEEKFNDGKSKAMEGIVEKFDQILQRKQDRDQKNSTFNLLFLLFLLETITLFGILIAKGLGKLSGLSDLTLQIVTGATIIQVSSMIIFIVLYLFKQDAQLDPSKIIEAVSVGLIKKIETDNKASEK